MLWILDWPLYHSDEMELLIRLRKGHGENRTLINTPGHVLVKDEREELVGFLFLMMAFGWDSLLLAARPTRIILISHDNFIKVLHGCEQKVLRIQEIVKTFGIQIA